MMAASLAEPTRHNSDANEENKPDWVLANEGIKFIINNQEEKAQEVFAKRKDSSLVVYAGYAISVFMDALMTLEEEKFSEAIAVLKELEKRCTADTGWFKSVKVRVFGSGQEEDDSLEKALETQIILADSLVCLAILIFMQQELSGYFKGGWVLRKSWKIYQNAYNDILQLYKANVGDFVLPESLHHVPRRTSSASNMEVETPDEIASPESSPLSEKPGNKDLKNGSQKPVDKETIIRLMGAVTFGYGLFHLGISLLPASLLKFTNLLGFRGNRKIGASCLMYARLGVDMRAPLASLTLLWYYTIVRPFYALDGTNIRAGVDYAELLIREAQGEYSDSALFLFFKGRVHRLQSDIPAAISAFQLSVNRAKREVKNLSLHEVGWCYLIQLDFKAAEETFANLKLSSRWSRPFYMYLSSICSNCYQSNFPSIGEFKLVMQNRRKQSQLDEFLLRRANCCPSKPEDMSKLSPIYWNFLVYEMLYLWNAMPSCNTHSVKIIIEDCESMDDVNNIKDEPMLGLSRLILGAAYSLQGRYYKAIECFRKCLELRKLVPHNAPDAHISAFSQYELGCLLLKSEQSEEEGKELLRTLTQYKDYDFEQRLHIRVQSLLKHT